MLRSAKSYRNQFHYNNYIDEGLHRATHRQLLIWSFITNLSKQYFVLPVRRPSSQDLSALLSVFVVIMH